MRKHLAAVAPAILAAAVLTASPAAASLNPTRYQDATAWAASISHQLRRLHRGDITYLGDPYTAGQLGADDPGLRPQRDEPSGAATGAHEPGAGLGS